jgi:hypothetical protein
MQAWEYALELRAELEEWWASPRGRSFGKRWHHLRADKTGLKQQAMDMAEIELVKLPVAAPFFVTDEMVDLLEHAAESFPSTPLHPVDLPIDTGFVLLGRSISVIDTHLKPLPIRAFTWGLARGVNPAETTGVHYSVYAHESDDVERKEADEAWGGMDNYFPTLSLLHDSGWTFGHEYTTAEGWTPGTVLNQGIEIPLESVHSAIHMMKVIHTFWMLSQQRIGDSNPQRASRGLRRRIERSFPNREIPEVRVITLRRRRPPRHSDEEVGSGREYTHRWWVNAHWRRQWYPSEGRHKPKYIEGYIKGPDDKPFQQKDTAYVWRR